MTQSPAVAEKTAALIASCLLKYRLKSAVMDYSEGSMFTLFRLAPSAGIRSSQISALIPELCRSLNVTEIRMIDFIPGTPYIGLLVKNKFRKIVSFSHCFTKWTEDKSLPQLSMMAGENITGEPVSLDLTQLPHLLIAGTTGSGKSMLMHSLILSLLYRTSPANVRLVLCDAHHPELSLYRDTPHLLLPVLSDSTEIAEALHFLTTEAEIRRKQFSVINAPDLRRYNEKIAIAESFGRPIPDPFWRPEDCMAEHPRLSHKPAIVICIENAVQLINDHSNIEDLILPLLQQGGMTGIHLLLTTRSPLPTKINQQLKFHIPARIAMTVTSKADSHFIIGQHGAEILSGDGDMLLITADSAEPQRIQGAYISDSDIHNAVDYCKKWGDVSYLNTGKTVVQNTCDLDPLFDRAVQFVTETQRVSISGIQREFRIGYNRAARIVEEMEESGIISEPFSDGRREVLVPGLF